MIKTIKNIKKELSTLLQITKYIIYLLIIKSNDKITLPTQNEPIKLKTHGQQPMDPDCLFNWNNTTVYVDSVKF